MKLAFSQRIVSSVLVFWLSGVALLFCCGNMEARAAAEADSCPLAKTSHCNKRSRGETKVDFARFQREESLTFDCCGFLPKVFDKARKIEKNPQTAAAMPSAKISAPKFSFVVDTIKAPKVYRPPVQNRGSTYLKNCVFRI
jgi:hypothetical protein